MTESPVPSHAPSRLERALLIVLGLAALVSLLAGLIGSRPAPGRDELLAATAAGYASFWAEVDAVAKSAAATLGAFDLEAAGSLERFERAAEALPADSERPWALYLIGPAGNLQAWSGEGLLHSLQEESLPARGRAYRSSLTAVTVLSVAEIETRPGWRVVVGLSLPTSELPFELPGRAHLQTHWGLGGVAQTVPGGRAGIVLGASPTLLIDEAELGVSSPQRPPWWAQPLTWLGAWLLVAAMVLPRRNPMLAAVLVAGGLVAWGTVAGASPGWLAALGAGVLALAASVAKAESRASVQRPVLVGALGAGSVVAAAWMTQRLGPFDLSDHFVAGGSAWAARTLLFLVTLCWLGLLIRGREEEVAEGRSRPVWLGALALAASAMLVDWRWPALALFLVAGAMLGGGLAGRSVRRRPLTVVGIVVIAALGSATASEIAYRAELRHDLPSSVLPALAPPTRAETADMRQRLAEHFRGLDLSDLAAGDILEVDADDLAFEIWRRSPLVRGRAVSAVALHGPDDQEFLFSFGIPIGDTGRPQVESRERPFDNPVWDFALINESGPVALAGLPWGEVEYWLLVRPGFRLAAEPLADVTGDLLRGGPSGRGAVQRQVAPASFTHYSSPRMARISPWIEAPELPRDVLENGSGMLRTPDGPSWVWTASEPEGTRALFLPRLGPIASFEEVGIHALGTLWPLVGLLLVVLLLQLSQSYFRLQLRLIWRSYARRLVLVFSLLVLVPAVVVDVLVLRAVRDRAESEQLSEARGALLAAQRVLGEYAASQDAGVSLSTVFDDDLLTWLASVLGHDVNLYWATSSELAASSRQELFAAGLLPRRVPGEIYSALRLRGARLASRLQHSGATSYTELYAPLTAPDGAQDDAKFFLSIPLLEQEEQISVEVEALRHKVVLATTLLVMLLVALGARLAAGFTAPLQELVEGTQRIAGGAERLGLEPRELELATLVEAIDRMAERIAEGRRRLLLEKRVVERMIDNITAAVVSIDSDHRVLMQNEVAVQLLGTEVGEVLEASLGEDAALGKVSEGLRHSREGGGPRTVSLPGAGDGEPRQWSVIWVPIPGEGEPAALIVVEDVTEVLRGQRLQAWAEMARIIAHEIKNPLTPIRLSAEHLREVRQRDPGNFDRVFDQCIGNILLHVEELRTISTEFSTYSRIPRIEPEFGDLAASVRQLVAGYQVAKPGGVSVNFSSGPEDVLTRFDAKLLGRALRNLIENSIRAVADSGRVDVSVSCEGGKAVIAVADNGPGVAADQLGKIFDPYFSTHDTGTGLGLPIARRIVEEHGGELHARNAGGGGLIVRVVLPLETEEPPGPAGADAGTA